MAQPKTHKFKRELQEISAFAKALAHPARLVIIKALLEREEASRTDFSAQIQLSKATILQHLEALEKIKLIKTKRKKGERIYSINLRVWEKQKELIKQFLVD